MKAGEVAIYVPTRGYVYAGTAVRLQEIRDAQEALPPISYLQNRVSVAEARNLIVQHFLASEASYLIMIDDDVIPSENLLQLVHTEADIAGGSVAFARPHSIFLPAAYRWDGGKRLYTPLPPPWEGITPVDAVGAACIGIRRRVLEDKELKAPFNALLDENGQIERSEDLHFCTRARARGYRIVANFDIWCEHYLQVHANGIAKAYLDVLSQSLDSVSTN
jgi:GT2 family glycosyltransferase